MRQFSLVVLMACGLGSGLAGCAPEPLTQADLAQMAHPSAQIRAQVEALMPAAMAELDPMEARILSEGRPLNAVETGYALKAGVHHPERVRVLAWQGRFPAPKNKALARVYKPANALAITFGYGIAARQEDPYLIAHELVHVAQYERLGGREAFTREYLTQELVLGGYATPLEREAFKRGHRIAPVPAGATRRWIESLD
ncbi:hypothetical protein [Thioclava kandeliae]|uniref:DUF4157 domain-containing protein n=1 Tax=Thioclava kandeliae TaxID=3070818 RepID=A0ABV1SHD3_9RHOB